MKHDFGICDCVRLKYNSVRSFPCGAEEFLFLWAGDFLDALTYKIKHIFLMSDFTCARPHYLQ